MSLSHSNVHSTIERPSLKHFHNAWVVYLSYKFLLIILINWVFMLSLVIISDAW